MFLKEEQRGISRLCRWHHRFLLREPQETAKQGMQLQLTKKGVHVSYVDKGVAKQNVKGKRKMSKKNSSNLYMLSIEENNCGINHAFSAGQKLVPGRWEQSNLRYYNGTWPSKRPQCISRYTV